MWESQFILSRGLSFLLVWYNHRFRSCARNNVFWMLFWKMLCWWSSYKKCGILIVKMLFDMIPLFLSNNHKIWCLGGRKTTWKFLLVLLLIAKCVFKMNIKWITKHFPRYFHIYFWRKFFLKNWKKITCGGMRKRTKKHIGDKCNVCVVVLLCRCSLSNLNF